MLDTFINSLTEKVRCTNNFEDGTAYRHKADALKCKYIEHNQLYKKYIIIDVDRPGSTFCFEELGMPVPSIITINPIKCTPHFVYQLREPVIYTEKGRSAPQKLYELVDSALTQAFRPFESDLAYVGKFTKNPLHPHWKVITNNIEYDLEDFGEYLDLSKSKRKSKLTLDYQGRNCTIFHNLRFWAYIEVRTHTDYESFKDAVETKAYYINAELSTSPWGSLNAKEVRGIANSVSRWTWKKRHSLDEIKNRGAMELYKTALPLDEKQRLAAGRTNNEQKNTTRSTLLASLAIMRAQGRPITQKSLEIHSKVSLSTIKRYWAEFEPMIYQKQNS